MSAHDSWLQMVLSSWDLEHPPPTKKLILAFQSHMLVSRSRCNLHKELRIWPSKRPRKMNRTRLPKVIGTWVHVGTCYFVRPSHNLIILHYSHVLMMIWILEPTEIISWTFVALAHERNLGLLQNLSSMTRQGLLETSTPKCSWTGGRAM